MTSTPDLASATGKHRTLGQQLNRRSATIHASWMVGLAVLLSGGLAAGGFSPAGVLFLIVLFSPIVIAYRRDRLSFPIVFATLFLPTWPWAVYKACSGRPRTV